MTASAAAITKQSNTSFYYSFSLLPRHKRDALHTVYAFCRYTDDLVDEERDETRKVVLLRRWRMELGLIRGMEMDLTRTRYETFDELEEYCRLVASSVGLMCRQIFGYRRESTREYAVHLGIALQLTNILRDLKDDAARGRIYLPLEDLRRFGYSEDDLFRSRYTPEFVNLMRFEVERARTYFRMAQEALTSDDKGFFFPARIMWSIYAHLLNRIERSQYNVFERRITISRLLRLLIAVRYWLSHQIRYRNRVAPAAAPSGE
jgi:phytoene synthase